MFTGIITNTGKFKKRQDSLFTFETDKIFCSKLSTGTSVSINGACFTVIKLQNGTEFSVEIMPESLKHTMLENLNTDDLINLELPTTPEMFLSGHIVQGHIDGTGKLQSIKNENISKILTIKLPAELNKYIVKKGSIAVNGISLTVIDIDNLSFKVGIIPFTWENTMLKELSVGDRVNIETDIIARYIEKLI